MKTQTQSHDEFVTMLNKVLGQIRERATNQFNYNWETNVGLGLVKPAECAEHALSNGLVSAISSFNSFDCDKTIRFAHDVLSYSNCHTEAKELNKFIPEYQ